MLLIANAIVAVLAFAALMIRPDWLAVKKLVTALRR